MLEEEEKKKKKNSRTPPYNKHISLTNSLLDATGPRSEVPAWKESIKTFKTCATGPPIRAFLTRSVSGPSHHRRRFSGSHLSQLRRKEGVYLRKKIILPRGRIPIPIPIQPSLTESARSLPAGQSRPQYSRGRKVRYNSNTPKRCHCNNSRTPPSPFATPLCEALFLFRRMGVIRINNERKGKESRSPSRTNPANIPERSARSNSILHHLYSVQTEGMAKIDDGAERFTLPYFFYKLFHIAILQYPDPTAISVIF